MFKAQVRNIVVSAGAFYLSWWVAPPLALGFGKLTRHISYMGDFGTAVEMPLVLNLPYAVVAVGVGACVAWLLVTDSVRWLGLWECSDDPTELKLFGRYASK
jgi:hypothetical protein